MSMLENAYDVLDRLRLPNGLYVASTSEHYQHVWIRDCCYISMAYLTKYDGTVERTIARLFDLFKDYAWKIECVLKQKPQFSWEYLHSRYSLDGKEITDQEWGHCQNDSIGAFLFLVGEAAKHGHQVIRNEDDLQVLRSLVEYLTAIEYWNCPDNGMWEENEEVHASSVGACVAGLNAIKDLVDVPLQLVANGVHTLHQMFPYESASKPVDMALLSLIYPYRLLDDISADMILWNIRKHLLGLRGVIRYKDDQYHNVNGEAEWPMGLAWLALCYEQIGDLNKAQDCLDWTEDVLQDGTFAESYYWGTNKPNPNTPLGWTAALYALAYEKIHANEGEHVGT